jgi:hypothetical protein
MSEKMDYADAVMVFAGQISHALFQAEENGLTPREQIEELRHMINSLEDDLDA